MSKQLSQIGEKGKLFTGGKKYAKFRPSYPSNLYNIIYNFIKTNNSENDNFSLAVDIGCGTGQVTEILGKSFKKVIGIDASLSQIEAIENESNNISYHVGTGENLESLVSSNSVDLITTAQTMHWLDQDLIWKEYDRILKPNGIIAIWGYSLPYSDNTSITSVISDYNKYLWDNGFWDDKRKLIDNHYSHISLPYSKQEIINLQMTKESTIDDLVGYLGTFSALKTSIEKTGSSILPQYEKRIRDIGSNKFNIIWPIFLFLTQKQ